MRSSRRNLSFPSSFIPRELMAGFLVFCLLLNGFVPRFSIGQKERDALSQLMARQSSLLYFLSLSTLPEMIVGDLMKKQGRSAAARKDTPPRERQERSSDSSSDFSLTAFDKKTGAPRLEHQFGAGKASFAAVVPSRPLMRPGDAVGKCSDPPGMLYVIMLLFFFSLARSSVNGNAAVVRPFARYM